MRSAATSTICCLPTPTLGLIAMLGRRISSLSAYFDHFDVLWKPVSISREKGVARAVPYLSNRAIMDRLDMVCGPENWRNEYSPGPEGGLLCGLSLRIVREDGSSEWVTKWDGAENTEVSPVKGGLSASMRRAAVQWGIGRYLYRIAPAKVRVDESGKMIERPRMPPEYLPSLDLMPGDPVLAPSGGDGQSVLMKQVA